MAQSPSLSSWVKVPSDSHFSINNLPYGVFEKANGDRHIGVAIGDDVLDLYEVAKAGYFEKSTHLANGRAFLQRGLNEFMGMGRPAWKEARKIIQDLLSTNCKDQARLFIEKECLVPQSKVKMQLPCKIHDYTDFYSSENHATNVGKMFRPNEEPLKPNWKHLPVGYHGRASSVVVSGTPVRRPVGQVSPAQEGGAPSFTSCKLLDIELELAFFVGGKCPPMGTPIKIADAYEHLFGVVLMNDWSARDIQTWEYVPLGPFNAKNFATSISPWIVTMEALEPFRVDLPKQTPTPLPYLRNSKDSLYDIHLEVALQSSKMKTPQVISRVNANNLYWSFQQQLAHHAITGCPMRPGDLCGSGTISGTTPDSRGSFLEITWRGTTPLKLSDGTERKFLADGDKVILSGVCKSDKGHVGFGSCEGVILPAVDINSFGKL